MKQGFSLVELSIVLVILGLLTGGILSGQSLIRASELRALSTEYQRYITAVHSFRDRYFQLPGDMNNAQSFWGIAHATPGTCVTTASTTPLTCNGNGNQQVFLSSGSNEVYRFWQHLSNAGLIEGSFDGITHGTTETSSTAANSPNSRINSALWYVEYWTGTIAGNSYLFDGQYGHILTVGAASANNIPGGKILRPDELWNMDVKFDDGKPATGKLVSNGLLASCTTTSSSSALTADYLLSGTSASCNAMFRNQF